MSDEKVHALLGPSKASRWMTCPGSVVIESTLPKQLRSSAAAEEGTAAHELAELCLTTPGALPAGYVGMAMSNGVVVTEDMAIHIGVYLDFVRGLACAIGDTILPEQELSLEEITGEEGAVGTADAVVMVADELIVVDLKFGKGHLVEADDNYQLIMYALAARKQFDLVHDSEKIRVIIHQTRRDHVPEAVYTMAELDAYEKIVNYASDKVWEQFARHADGVALFDLELHASESACQWCPVKGTCQELAKTVEEVTELQFQVIEHDLGDATKLGKHKDMVQLVRAWCDAVDEDVARELKNGGTIPGWKLVTGKKGNRQWQDEAEAEKLLKAAKLKRDEMYVEKLVSPTKIDAFHKLGRFSPRMWAKLQDNVVSPAGSPTVAPEGDKRPAITIQNLEFEIIP